MEIKQAILTKNPCYTAGRKITVKGLMLHSIGCPQPNAQVFIQNWNSPSYNSACVHAFIDGNTGIVYQTLPWNHRGWHGGGASNNTHIGVEMCEPSCIQYTGGASFTCTDKEKAQQSARKTYNAAVELFAYLCRQYTLNPLADGVILSHAEGYKRGIATNHGDPEHLWRGLSLPYTMDGFRNDVKNKMEVEQPMTKEEKATLKALNDALYEVSKKVKALEQKAQCAGTADTLPKWAKDTVAKLIRKGWLKGDAQGKLNLSENMLRLLVINDRAGVYGD